MNNSGNMSVKKSTLISVLVTVLICFFTIIVTGCGSSANSKSNFEFTKVANEGDGCFCSVLKTDAKKIKIPAQYDGESVVQVRSEYATNTATEKVVFPEGIKKISGFEDWKVLKSVSVPSSVKYIESAAFSYCDSLEKVEFLGDIELLDDAAFEHCPSLNQVIFHGNVTTIGRNAFNNCPNLEEVIFEGKVGTVGAGAFSNCSSLSKIEFPEGTAVNSTAFTEDTEIKIGDGGVYYYCDEAYDKDALIAQAETILGAEFDESKECNLSDFAVIWNGPLITVNQCADCSPSEYSAEYIPEDTELELIDVSEIHYLYPDTVYTEQKAQRVLNGSDSLVYCLCEWNGHTEGPEYEYGGVIADYLSYRVSFHDAASGELLGWSSFLVGTAPASYTSNDTVTFEVPIGNGETIDCFNNNGMSVPIPLRSVIELVYPQFELQ